MTQHFASIGQDQFLSRLITTAKERADTPALIHKQRGRWIFWRWRDALHEVDVLASGLRQLGLRPRRTAVVDGEVGANLFLVSAAVRAAGARLCPVALTATGDELVHILSDSTVGVVIAQGREALAEWNAAARSVRGVPIVFDHTTPDNRSPESGVVTFDELKRLGRPANWAAGVQATRRNRPSVLTWFEESTDWTDGLDIILDHWVSTGTTIALPEVLVASSRDRFELRPRRWIASSVRIGANAQLIRDRLPGASSSGHSLVDGVLRGRRAPWHAATRWRIKKRIGLSRVHNIDVHLVPHSGVSSEDDSFFKGLGAPLRIAADARSKLAAE